MPLATLTEKQQTFLDDYIRKHSILGRKKEGDAEKYRRRKGKVLDALAKLPDFPEVTKGLKDDIAAADTQADAGNFRDAYHALKAVKKAARERAASYDPQPEINKFIKEAGDFCDLGRAAAAELGKMAAWGSGPAVKHLARAKDIATSAVTGSVPKSPGKDPVAAAATNLEDLERRFWAEFQGACDYSQVDKFLATAANREHDLSIRMQELAKAAKEPKHTSELRTTGRKISDGVLSNTVLAPLRRGAEKYVAAAEHLATQKKPFETQFSQFHALLSESGRQSPEGKPASDAMLEQLHDKVFVDGQTQEKARRPRQRESFGNALMGSMGEQPTLEDRDYNWDDPQRQEAIKTIKDSAKLVLDLLDDDSDELFDLMVKSIDEIKIEYADSRGWGRDPKKWTEAQRQTVHVAAVALRQAAGERAPDKFDPKTQILTHNGHRYGNPKKLGSGGMGVVLRYEDLDNPGQFVAMKMPMAYVMDGDFIAEEDRADMAKELRNHREAMDGQDDAMGRKNILEMKGMAMSPSGAAFEIMELATGGDMSEMSGAMDIVSDVGALPEEARNVLNQFVVKQAYEGMAFIRDQNLVHFDVKEGNIFVMADGTVKVADFGGAQVATNTDGQVVTDKDQPFTPGYAPEEVINATGGAKANVDTKVDTFAMGRVAQGLQSGGGVEHDRERHAILPENLTGALGRMTSGMTSENPDDRLTMEAALDSSYLKNLENYDEQAVKDLMQAVVAYGKCVKGSTARHLKVDIDDLQKKIAKEEATMKDPQADANAQADAKKSWEQLRKELAEKHDELRKLGDNPEAKALAEEIRLLSERLVRPSGSDKKPDEAAVQKFIQDINAASGNFQVLWNIVRQTAHYDLFKEAGVPQRDVVAALRCLDLDLTANNPRAFVQLEQATAGLDKLLAKVKQAPLRKALRQAAASVAQSLEAKFNAQGGGLDNQRQAKEQVLKGIQGATAFAELHESELAKQLTLAEKITSEGQQAVEDLLQLIANGFAPPPQGIETQFEMLKSRLQGVKADVEEALPTIQRQFDKGAPPEAEASRFGLEKQLSDVAARVRRLKSDAEARLKRCEQWLDQAHQAAAESLAGRMESNAALEKVLAAKIQKINAGPWTAISQTARGLDARLKRTDALLDALKGSYLPNA